jgi:hypothetical protein
MATKFQVVALALLLTICVAASNLPTKRIRQARPLRAATSSAIANASALDDVHKLWTWIGPQGRGEAHLLAAAPIRYFAYEHRHQLEGGAPGGRHHHTHNNRSGRLSVHVQRSPGPL